MKFMTQTAKYGWKKYNMNGNTLTRLKTEYLPK
jgi:hypothetical protein